MTCDVLVGTKMRGVNSKTLSMNTIMKLTHKTTKKSHFEDMNVGCKMRSRIFGFRENFFQNISNKKLMWFDQSLQVVTIRWP
jgi:hypothetical protein